MREEGYFIKVHHSVVKPILVAGIPRNACFILWTFVAALAIGQSQFWVVPMGVLVHVGFFHLTKQDVYFFNIIHYVLKSQKPLCP